MDMNDFLSIVRQMVRSPLLYGYWLTHGIGLVMSDINEGARGWWVYGLVSIISMIISTTLFFWHLHNLRKGRGFPVERNGIELFLSIFAYRIRLLLIFSPLVIYFFWAGNFDSFTRAYFTMTMASGETKLAAISDLLALAWPWMLAMLIYITLELGGRSFVVAQEHSSNAVKRCLRVAWSLKAPLGILMAIEILFFLTDSVGTHLKAQEIITPWVEPALRIALTPVEYILSIGGTIYMATILWTKNPGLFQKKA